MNDEIWGSTISTFNDPYECLPCYDLEKINEQMDWEFSSESFKHNLYRISSNDIPDEMASAFDPSIVEALRVYSEQLLYADITDVLQSIKNQVINICNSNMDYFRKLFVTEILQRENMFHVASFSESCHSTLMWAHYANGHTGFCLEYDFGSCLCDCSEKCDSISSCPGFMLNYSIAPIIYSERRYDASAGFMSMIVNWVIEALGLKMKNVYYDMFLPQKTMLTKSNAWAYEQEWRLFQPCELSKLTPHKMIGRMKPSAVYLGASIKVHNKQRIINICQAKNIPCYQMCPQYFTSQYECAPYQLI